MTTQISSYEQQAIDFLSATQTEMKAEFLEYNYHFDDDKHKRNIFKITLSNSRHKYHFKFGASINDSVKNPKDVSYETEIDFYSGLRFPVLKMEFLSYRAKIKINALKEAKTFNDCKLLIDKRKAQAIYDDFIKTNTGKYHKINILPFNEWFEKIVQRLVQHTTELANKNWGEGIPTDTPTSPTAYDILACIQKYEVTTFEDFCSEFGYDTDSRKAYKTYKAVKREWENLNKLFTNEELELLREIN